MVWPEPFAYYGTSSFSRTVLQGLLQAGVTPELVVTTKPRPAGRGLGVSATPVGEAASQAALPLLEVATLKSADVRAQLEGYRCSFAVLAAFGKIIPSPLLDIYSRGVVNIHPSLLPRYRGPSPIQCAIRDGAAQTGVTLIVLDDEVDHGPILAQEICAIEASDDAVSLGDRLAHLAVPLLRQVLPRYLSGELVPQAQDHVQATFTAMVSRSDGQADFSHTADELSRQGRAFAPWPGLWATWQGKRVKLVGATAQPDYHGEAGLVALVHGALLVGCGRGGLVLQQLQLEGGRVLPAAEFVRGHRSFIGSHLA